MQFRSNFSYNANLTYYIDKKLKYSLNFSLPKTKQKWMFIFYTDYIKLKKFKNNNPVLNLLKIFSKHGLQIKFWSILNKSIFYFYYRFYFFNKNAALYNKKYFLLMDLFVWDNFFFFNSVVIWFSNILEPIFSFVVKKVEKKFRKKLKKKFTATCIYIFPKKRLNLVIRNLLNYSNLFEDYNITKRLGKSFLRTFIEYKESDLYKKKIAAYSEILKNQQNNVIN